MRHLSLSRMKKYHYLSDLCKQGGSSLHPEKLITDIGLYEGVLLNVLDIREARESQNPQLIRFLVSPDVETLHDCFGFHDRVMMPCPICKRQQPFDLKYSFFVNERGFNESEYKIDKCLDSRLLHIKMREKEVRKNHSIPEPCYIRGINELASCYNKDYECCNDDVYIDECFFACMEGILNQVGVFRINYSCALDETHKGFADYVIYRAVGEREELSREFDSLYGCLVLEKVGQYPSMADMQMFEIEKFRAVMSNNQFRDFKMALGLYASGVGCGSFLYLRRIMEELVSEAAKDLSKEEGWSEEIFAGKRFNEKIDYIEGLGKQVIPSELEPVRNRIYGVLSKGVHCSTDQECKELFPTMKHVIEELLYHKLEGLEKEKRLRRAKEALEKIT